MESYQSICIKLEVTSTRRSAIEIKKFKVINKYNYLVSEIKRWIIDY